MNKTYCDFCGKEIAYSEDSFSARLLGGATLLTFKLIHIGTNDWQTVLDVCEECAKDAIASILAKQKA